MKTNTIAPPSKEIFDDIKANALKICDKFNLEEKRKRIESIGNVRENCTSIISLFDIINQARLITMVNIESVRWMKKLFKNNSQK